CAGRVPDGPDPALGGCQAQPPACSATESHDGCRCQWDPVPWWSDGAGSPLRWYLGSATPASALCSPGASAPDGGVSTAHRSPQGSARSDRLPPKPLPPASAPAKKPLDHGRWLA